MTQQFPTEDPKDPRNPWEAWEESSPGGDFDASKPYGGEVFHQGGDVDEHFSSPQPPDEEAETGFPWQSGAPNQRTTSSKPLPWEVNSNNSSATSGPSYQNQSPPRNPVPPPSGPAKNVPQPKKLTSDIWQNIPLWGYVGAATALILSLGVVWTANNIPKDAGVAPPSAVAGNSPAGAGGGASGSSPPVRPMRSRVAPGSSSKEGATPGYVPQEKSTVSTPPSENSPDSPSLAGSAESTYMSPIAADSTEAEGGPKNPFSPAYPEAKPAEPPKPAPAPPPAKPQPLPPPPKAPPAVLSLEGVATDGNTKLAIVRVGDQPSTAEAQVGAKIEGWTVTSISDQTVTLSKGKQRQVLRLP
jgi:hypothetical protein